MLGSGSQGKNTFVWHAICNKVYSTCIRSYSARTIILCMCHSLTKNSVLAGFAGRAKGQCCYRICGAVPSPNDRRTVLLQGCEVPSDSAYVYIPMNHAISMLPNKTKKNNNNNPVLLQAL